MEYLDIFVRILSALLLGFAIGLEREMTNKYAGLRTNILVCLGACIFTIISIYGFPTFAEGDNVVVSQATGVRDTARIAAQVVTGTVFGLTTAATLWIAASIGMACGAGMYIVAIVGTILSIITLVSVRVFEKNVLISSTKNTKRLKVNISCLSEKSDDIYNYLVEHYTHLREISKKYNKQDESLTKINVILDVTGRKPIQTMYKTFQKID